MNEVEPLILRPPGGYELLDQTLLPGEERMLAITSIAAACEAIRSLRVRGAPLLGIAAAATMALAAEVTDASDASLESAARQISGVRPTAVELGARAVEALAAALGSGTDAATRRAALWAFAARILEERKQQDRAMGQLGASLLQPGTSVLTHCNTGALATGGIGTALGIIRTGWEHGQVQQCFATETRPLLQGARLTMWELARAGIPATLLPDTAAAALIASGNVQAVIVGADRIAANGDTANKIGTYGLAAVAARHGVPFYIAAPNSTFDPSCPGGSAIPIEFRQEDEVGGFGSQRWSPEGSRGYNPAFDVTPGELITAFVTERAIVRPPYAEGLRSLLAR
ncbi:MAG: S-methyl-5-thioribose-1-phosphate isomerase [Tepidiformaceae bacterium]